MPGILDGKRLGECKVLLKDPPGESPNGIGIRIGNVELVTDLQAVGIEVGGTHRGPAIADNGLHVCHSGIAIDFRACLQKLSCSLVVCQVHDLLEGQGWNDDPDINTTPAGGEKGVKNAVAGNVFVLNPDPAAARADGFENCYEWLAAVFKKVCSQDPDGKGSGGRRTCPGRGRRWTAEEREASKEIFGGNLKPVIGDDGLDYISNVVQDLSSQEKTDARKHLGHSSAILSTLVKLDDKTVGSNTTTRGGSDSRNSRQRVLDVPFDMELDESKRKSKAKSTYSVKDGNASTTNMYCTVPELGKKVQEKIGYLLAYYF